MFVAYCLREAFIILTSYAVIQTGGKQYQVKSGDVIDVEKLEAQVGSRVELADVRFVSEESGVSVGTPTVDGAMVTAEVEDQFRGPKISVFKYKSKPTTGRRMVIVKVIHGSGSRIFSQAVQHLLRW